MHHNVYTFFSVYNCLDEEFDAPDAAADRDLCRAIAAGKAGMHPEAWDSRSALTAVMPQGFRGYEWVPANYRRPIARSAFSVEEEAERQRRDAEWEAKHRRRPIEEPKPPSKRRERPPRWRLPIPTYPVEGDTVGTVQLTCDECYAARRATRLNRTVTYGQHGRPAAVEAIRAIGRQVGWTCIVGRDRCPRCSQPAAPKPVGNGAGASQGHE